MCGVFCESRTSTHLILSSFQSFVVVVAVLSVSWHVVYHCFSLCGSVFELFLVNAFQSADCRSQFSKVGTLGESDGYRLPVRTPPLLPSTHCSQAVVRNLQQQMERRVSEPRISPAHCDTHWYWKGPLPRDLCHISGN